jgi:hypothetical protein
VRTFLPRPTLTAVYAQALTATAGGEGRIDLSWNTLTDNVGVTGYRLERCQGASCTGTDFAELSIPPGSLQRYLFASPKHPYRYRVRATDGAGNLSVFSSIASATTQAATGTQLPLGALAHDGPATPEQISLVLPVTNTGLPQTATAAVHYKADRFTAVDYGHP